MGGLCNLRQTSRPKLPNFSQIVSFYAALRSKLAYSSDRGVRDLIPIEIAKLSVAVETTIIQTKPAFRQAQAAPTRVTNHSLAKIH